MPTSVGEGLLYAKLAGRARVSKKSTNFDLMADPV